SIGYVGDVLSYARLLALGLATGVIAIVVNQIATLALQIPIVGIVGMVVILAGGHVFNLLVNTLGSFVHSGRLQFVEFFTKFFEGGGQGFRPFRRESRYTTVKAKTQT
ncbi:MAG TPA: V-type ATP synthase subunit I, partial [Clostridia bacterium]|nr:V-type ATP synthase subunit I [Clostridia bacterium]